MRKFPSQSAIRGIEPTDQQIKSLPALPLSYMAPTSKLIFKGANNENPSHDIKIVEIDTTGFEPASCQRTMPKYVDRATITLVPYHIK